MESSSLIWEQHNSQLCACLMHTSTSTSGQVAGYNISNSAEMKLKSVRHLSRTINIPQVSIQIYSNINIL